MSGLAAVRCAISPFESHIAELLRRGERTNRDAYIIILDVFRAARTVTELRSQQYSGKCQLCTTGYFCKASTRPAVQKKNSWCLLQAFVKRGTVDNLQEILPATWPCVCGIGKLGENRSISC